MFVSMFSVRTIKITQKLIWTYNVLHAHCVAVNLTTIDVDVGG